MIINNNEYFVMIEVKTRKKYLCSWFEDQLDYFNQKVYYIGVTNGLGGYNYLLKNGFIDRRGFKKYQRNFNKVELYKFKNKK